MQEEAMNQPLPNFLIIGAAKSGTTSLYHYLKQHPQVFMSPVKETNFFALEGHPLDFKGPGDKKAISSFSVTQWNDYINLFQNVTSEKAIGEVSPLYLYHPEAPFRINEKLPNIKLISVIRNPVERAYSSFLHLRRDGREPIKEFNKALNQEDERIQNNWEHIWHYVCMGFYSIQFKRYFDIYQPEQIKIFLYEDLKHNPLRVIHEILTFLEIDSTFHPDVSERHNQSFIARSDGLKRFLKNEGAVKTILRRSLPDALLQKGYNTLTSLNKKRPSMDKKTRNFLVDVFRPDIIKLSHMINRDLSSWMNV